MAEPIIITYTRLLHEHGNPKASAVVKFLEKHAEDVAFQRRADKLNTLFILRTTLVADNDDAKKSSLS